MDFSQLLDNQQRKQKLVRRRQKRIRQKITQKKKESVNYDHDHLKTGKMEKTKIIAKKTFKTSVQKARNIPVQLQSNVDVNTFLSESSEYLNFLARTKQYVSFNPEQLNEGCKAISAYASEHRQRNITIDLEMENEVECNERPTLLHLAYPQTNISCIVITNNPALIQTHQFKNVDMRVMSLKQFAEKYKGDKKFKSILKKKLMRIFSTFPIFAKSKLIQKIIRFGIPVFPIDHRKVPFSLQHQCPDYSSYINFLLEKSFCITKSGKEHLVRVKNRPWNELEGNVKQIVHQLVARLIQRSKKKGNKLASVKLKTETSIPICVYD